MAERLRASSPPKPPPHDHDPASSCGRGAACEVCVSPTLAVDLVGEVASTTRSRMRDALTLRAWRDLWVSNKAAVIAAYGQRWYRLWYFFLHWSALMGEQGTGFTYQVTMHKNHERFDRSMKTRKS